MKTSRHSTHPKSKRNSASIRALLLLCLAAIAAPVLLAQRAAIATRASQAISANSAVDTGQLPVSEPLSLTVRLRPTSAQLAALDQLLAAQTDATSPRFHHWLTTSQYAEQFGATPEQLATVTTYLQSHGLTVTSVSPSQTRLNVSGTAGQAQLAFATPLHRFSIGGTPYFANAAEPTLPPDVAALIAGISGLDNLPQPASARIGLGGAPIPATARLASASLAGSTTPAETATPSDPLSIISAAVDANSSPILNLTSSACSPDLSAADVEAWRAIFRQASAQGITVLATSSCPVSSTSSFPSSLSEVTSLTVAPRELTAATNGIEARPTWQAAPGLPADALRHEPDLTTTSAAAFAQAISTLSQQTGNRLGNVNSTLYALAKTPGLFTQPDATPATASAGNWEPATGLGTIDLNTLIKAFPRGLTGVSIDFQASTYSVSYGTPFTLNAIINPSTFNTAAPTGTVVFTASTQGVLGSAAVNNGIASITPGVLPVGTYSIIATYSGDGNYAASSKAGVNVYVAIVKANLQATLSPSVSVPYGSTATATATVTLPGSSASPSGDVYAQIESVTGAFYSATLSPNAGSNSATANIVLSAPSPGSYTVEVSCQGSQNFQCQTPVDLSLRTVKGYTSTTVSVNPAAPQAGQPIYITATVANSGNATGTYVYGGSIGFYDSGKLIASAPVATNQATASVSLSGTRTHNLTAVYSGDTNWNTSNSGAVAVLPTMLPTALTITTNTNGFSSLAGVNIIFTAAVTTNTNYGSGPTGYVTFFDTYNGAVLQLGNGAILIPNGPNAAISLFTSTGLLPGLHHIYAQYTGDDFYSSVISPVTTLSISDFSVTMNPSTLTVTQGQSGTGTALIGASGGFTGTVSLGCSPPGNSEATCTISPASVSPGQTATLTILTAAPRSTRSSQQARLAGGWSCATGATLATLVFFLVPRRRPLASLLMLLVAVSLTANLGCGIGVTTATVPVTGGGSNPADPGTPLGTENYTITASGSDGVNTARHTYQYQVTVQ